MLGCGGMAEPSRDKGVNGAPSGQGFFTSERLLNIAEGAFIAALGGAFAYGGFHFGLRRSIERAKTDFDDKRLAEVDPNKVGPSGVPAKQLALKAFARGSAVAFLVASVAGVGLSYLVEAKHRGVSKEQEEREMQELYKILGLNKTGDAPEGEQGQ
jgi:hypothetical protein